MTMVAHTLSRAPAHPVVLFNLLGLGLFAVTGAQKAIIPGHDSAVAVLLGMVTSAAASPATGC
jgi:uncharacterized membrane protein YeiH